MSVEAHCWHKGLLWSEQGSCEWKGDLSMDKDGVQAWKEHWGKTTEATHRGDTSVYDLYRCRGEGKYTLTLDAIQFWSSNNGIRGDWHVVEMKPVSVTESGC